MKYGVFAILGLVFCVNAGAESTLPFRLKHNVNAGAKLVPLKPPTNTRDANGYRTNGFTFTSDGTKASLSNLAVAIYDNTKLKPGKPMTALANTTSNAGNSDVPDVKDPLSYSHSCPWTGSSCAVSGSFSNDPLTGSSVGADDTVSYQWSADFGFSWNTVTNQDLNGSRTFAVTTISEGQEIMIRNVTYTNTTADPDYSIANLKGNPLFSCACFSF